MNTADVSMRDGMQHRTLYNREATFETRDDGDVPVIEGYFAVFNSDYQISPSMSESIAPGAFTRSLSNDVRALTNHDTSMVLGRCKAHTFEMRQDEHGLWGRITINPNDSDAMNTYERVKRGDVDGCSIGFNIVSERTDISDNGDVHWTIEDVELFECSVCTFPAYEATSISARENDYREIMKRQTEAWKENMKARLRNGVKTVDAAQED